MKIAIAQVNTIVGDIQGNRTLIEGAVKDALEKNVEMLLFPPIVTAGYPSGELLKSSGFIDDNLKTLDAIVQASLGHDMAICLGHIHRDEKNSSILFNSASFIYNGEVLLQQHKTVLTKQDFFDERDFFSPGQHHGVVTFKGVKIALTLGEDLCGDRSSCPEPVEVLAQKGARLIINLASEPAFMVERERRFSELVEISRSHNVDIVHVNHLGGNDSLVFDGMGVFIDKDAGVVGRTPAFQEGVFLLHDSEKLKTPLLEPENEYLLKTLTMGLRDYAVKSGFTRAVLGLSGGIDSALVAAIACDALGAENVTGITMPSPYSSPGSVDHSQVLADNLGMKMERIDISRLFELFQSELSPLFEGMDADVTEENLQARIRGTLLMAVSNKRKALLLNTGNRSELATGYCTLYGDMNGGLGVISHIPKTLVYGLSRYINEKRGAEIIPWYILEKAPSAELRPDQKDEDSLPPYDVLDHILKLHIEEGASLDDIAALGYERDEVNRILRLVELNEYKRFQAPPGIRVSSKTFYKGKFPLVKKRAFTC